MVLQQLLAQGIEGVAVEGARAVLGDGIQVIGSAIPFVTAESIHRILAVLSNHVTVAGHFCQDGSSGNAEAFAVALDHSLLGQAEGAQGEVAIYEQKVWRG